MIDFKKMVLENGKYLMTQSHCIFKPSQVIELNTCDENIEPVIYMTDEEFAERSFDANNIPKEYQHFIFRKNAFNTCSEIFTDKRYQLSKGIYSQNEEVAAWSFDQNSNNRSSFIVNCTYLPYDDIYYFLKHLEFLGLYDDYVKSIMDFYNIDDYNLDKITHKVLRRENTLYTHNK